MEDLSKLLTESRSPYLELDNSSTTEILEIINNEDQKVALAVKNEIPNIVKAVEMISECLKTGGRLLYAGAGTSGRLGVLDAFECPPTFGVEPDVVQGIIAGGNRAFESAVEDVEDSMEEAVSDLNERCLSPYDAVVAIAASGRTPYCIGALREATRIGARTIAIVCNVESPMSSLAEVTICPLVGAEVVMGSTRMKAGTAQKMVLNMLSTSSMIKLGKVYTNLMVDLKATNSKLRDRACRVVTLATGSEPDLVREALVKSEYNPKIAIVMLLAGCSYIEAVQRLDTAGGFVRRAIGIS